MRPHHCPSVILDFFFESYRTEVFWFELVWIARRLALALAISIIPHEDAFHGFTIALTLLVSMAIQQAVVPFRHNVENVMEQVSLMVLLLTFISITQLIFLEDGQLSKDVLRVFIFSCNAVVVLVFVGIMVWPYLKTRYTMYKVWLASALHQQKRFMYSNKNK